MSIENLLSSECMVFILLLAAILKAVKGQWEHFFTRFVAAVWFSYVWMFNPDVITTRIMGRWVFSLIMIAEILSFFLRLHHTKSLNRLKENFLGEKQ